MGFQQQLIFLFSALGAVNGFVLSGYFLFTNKERRVSNYFLSGLLLMLSIRIIKSVFLFFNRDLFEFFIQFGLTACFLIGPFLYFYVGSMTGRINHPKRIWWHLILFGGGISIFGYFYGYRSNWEMWQTVIYFIYKQWLLYILAAGWLMRDVFRKLWQQRNQINDQEIWLLNIYIGTFIIWLAYNTSSYTSYIVGALSFSFVFYISVLLWLYKRSKKAIAIDTPTKYANSSLDTTEAKSYMHQLTTLMHEEKPFLDPQLTLAKLSTQLGINSKVLSQVINQVTQQNYSRYIAGLRVEEAKRLLHSPDYEHYKIAAIAYESGFNSLSSFNAAFKESVGMTAKAYRKLKA